MLAIAVALIDAIVIWLIGPFGLLGLIAGLTAITFVLARRFAGVHAGSHTGMHTEARAGLHAGARPPETRLRPGARIALWLGEIAAAWSLFLFWLPLEWSANGRHMAVGSAWLAQLAADEAARAADEAASTAGQTVAAAGDIADAARQPQPWPCPIVSIYSLDDNIALPPRSAQLAGARNIELTGIGHISLPLARRVIDLVLIEAAG